MRINSVVLNDFGLYRGRNEILFPNDNSRHITLVGGLNGRGKTTLLDAIILAMYGKRALRYLSDERVKYSQYINNHINKSASPRRSSVKIVFSEVNLSISELTLERAWNDDGKNTIEDLTIKHDGINDTYLSEHWDYYVEEILPLSISRFFFFDNEKISQIADDETFESVKASIKTLLGLTTIDQLITDIRKLSRSTYSEKKNGEVNEELSRLQDIEQSILDTENEIAQLVQSNAGIRTRIGVLQRDYSQLEKKFWEKGGNLGLEKEQMIKKRDKINEELDQAKSKTLELLSASATPLHMCANLINRTLDTVSQSELYKAVLYSKRVFELLENMLNTSSYDPEYTEAIKQFLKDSQKTMHDSFKSADLYQGFSESSSVLLKNLVEIHDEACEKIQAHLSHVQSLHDEITNLELILSFEASENDVKTIWNKMQALTSEQLQCEVQLKMNEEHEQQLHNRIETLKHRRESLHRTQLSNIQYQDENVRIISYSSMTERIMEEYKKKIQRRRTKELEQKIYQCFSFMMQKNSMIEGIHINPDTLDITLIDYNGNELLKDQLSAGEKQLFAVSLLWGLAQSSGYRMPVIIDTPLGRLDSNHRTNFVERYLPFAAQQVIVLSTDEEINGHYWELIQSHVNAAYTLIYNDKTHSTEIVSGYFWEVKADDTQTN